MACRLNDRLDDESIRAELGAEGRTRIRSFLRDEDARHILACLSASAQWRHVLNSGEKVYEIADADHRAMPIEQARTLERLTYRSASERFQYRYDTIRIADRNVEPCFSGSALADFVQLMNMPETLSRLRSWTGAEDVTFADCQATRYQAGDFLTRHDDDVEGKSRRFAYVLSLSENWDADWGGLLLIQNKAGEVERALAPEFNALTLCAVGQPHSVSMIAPFAARPRLSLTGWLRSDGNES
jgi:hypothetical protein